MDKSIKKPPPTIAELNDLFRKNPTPIIGKPQVPGKLLTTQGISALSQEDQASILAKVRDFSDFTEENDPYGEHDFGLLEHQDQKIFWKIDYYAPDMNSGSEDPADLGQTIRVLTVMLADEY